MNIEWGVLQSMISAASGLAGVWLSMSASPKTAVRGGERGRNSVAITS